MENVNLKVTSLNELQSYTRGQVVELPPFADNQPFVARLARPSMLKLVRDGKVPNSLIGKANALFKGNAAFSVDDEKALNELFQVLDIFADACLLEPSMSDIKEAGLELTDEQLMFIFNYGQIGIKQLENFRSQQGNIKPHKPVANIPNKAKRLVGDNK